MKLPQGAELLAAILILATIAIIWGGVLFVMIQSLVR
jgi:hypothetical protein